MSEMDHVRTNSLLEQIRNLLVLHVTRFHGLPGGVSVEKVAEAVGWTVEEVREMADLPSSKPTVESDA